MHPLDIDGYALYNTKGFAVILGLQRYSSGPRGGTRNAIGRYPVRGFESHPLRSKKSSLHAGLRHAGFFFCLDF